VHVLIIGDALVGSAGAEAGEVLLALPCGARGTALRPAELAWLTGQLGCWREVAGISDALLAAAGMDGHAGRPALSVDEGLLGPRPRTTRATAAARRTTTRGCGASSNG
jgi:hypothetical protein